MSICPPEHRHAAVRTCYAIHQCRCDDCRAGQSVYENRRNKLHAYGRWVDPYIPAEPVREHVEMLQGFGYGWKRIAEMSGVGNTAISQLIYGRNGSNTDPRKGEVLKRVGREKAAKILAVTPDIDTLPGGASVPARGTRRRLQALVSMGWSQSKLAVRLGVEITNFGGMLTRDRVLVSTHRAVVALFDELWDQEPPHDEWRSLSAYNRTVRYAKSRRWLGPLAWDDIDNDLEPTVVETEGGIDPIAVELAMHGERVRLTGEERREAITRLHAERWSDKRIAQTMGIADRTVLRIRQELGLDAFEFGDLRQVGAA